MRYMRRIICSTLACVLFLPYPGFASTGRIDQKKIEALIAESKAEAVALAFYDLATGEQIFIRPDDSFHAASTMKVPVMMEVFRQAKVGGLSLDDTLLINNNFRSIVDGTLYSISPESDSDQTLYKKVGEVEPVRDLLRLMITTSSNLATNILIERVGATRVTEFMRKVGAVNIRVLRGVEDGKAFERGLNNTTTARDLLIILRSIAERRAVSAKASDEMIQIMSDQKYNEAIPSGLPAGVKVAHKTGSITKINHDAGIIYPPGRKPYVLVVLTRGIEDENRAHKLIGEISRVIYESLAAPRH